MHRGHKYFGVTHGEREEGRHYGADWLIYAGIAASLAAAGASAYGAYEAGQARKEAADYNRKVAEQNAEMARQQAEIEAQTLQEKQRQLAARQRAAIASSGVEEEGSPLLVEADTAKQMARDLYLTRYGGAARARAFESEAGLQSIYARSYSRAGQIGAASALLTGASGTASALYGGRSGYGYYGYGRYSPQSQAS